MGFIGLRPKGEVTKSESALDVLGWSAKAGQPESERYQRAAPIPFGCDCGENIEKASVRWLAARRGLSFTRRSFWLLLGGRWWVSSDVGSSAASQLLREVVRLASIRHATVHQALGSAACTGEEDAPCGAVGLVG